MMSELRICRALSSAKSQAQMPELSGCSGLISRAQAKTLRTSGREAVRLPELPGSLYRSQNRMRLSLRKADSTSCTYGLSLLKVAESREAGSPGSCIQPELWMPLFGAGCRPAWGSLFQQSSKNTKMVWMWCFSEMARYSFTLFLKPAGSCCHARLCRNTRMVLNPMPSAQPSSRSMVVGSKVAACHISSWLMAVLGAKLAPLIQGCARYQAWALAAGQTGPAVAATVALVLIFVFWAKPPVAASSSQPRRRSFFMRGFWGKVEVCINSSNGHAYRASAQSKHFYCFVEWP